MCVCLHYYIIIYLFITLFSSANVPVTAPNGRGTCLEVLLTDNGSH